MREKNPHSSGEPGSPAADWSQVPTEAELAAVDWAQIGAELEEHRTITSYVHDLRDRLASGDETATQDALDIHGVRFRPVGLVRSLADTDKPKKRGLPKRPGRGL